MADLNVTGDPVPAFLEVVRRQLHQVPQGLGLDFSEALPRLLQLLVLGALEVGSRLDLVGDTEDFLDLE